MPCVSLERQLQCAKREVALRKNVYRHRVYSHKMTQEDADEELAAMEAIVETLTHLVVTMQTQLSLL